MYYQHSKIVIKKNKHLLIISPDNSVISWHGGNFCGIECEAGISITNNRIAFAKRCKSIGGYEIDGDEHSFTNKIRFS